MARPKAASPRDQIITLRLTSDERTSFAAKAQMLGFSGVSDYIRFLHRQQSTLNERAATVEDRRTEFPRRLAKTFRRFCHGRMVLGDSRAFLFNTAQASVDLIVTSPPFGLLQPKSYGNVDADVYLNWFRLFAEGFMRVLKETGSLVLDVGGVWNRGLPTRSLYQFKLLEMLVEQYGFHLAQEHYWWNPAKLPSPATWVTVRRVRVKDAVNTIWWLSKTPYPKANNRNVLVPYSAAMKALLARGPLGGKRPSGHDLSGEFRNDNGGAIPPNLLTIANTESNSAYQRYCRERGLPVHPARFPAALPEYFIRLLTSPGDLVVDPFAGSCVTGAVAHALGRRWICCELERDYLDGALSRFE